MMSLCCHTALEHLILMPAAAEFNKYTRSRVRSLTLNFIIIHMTPCKFSGLKWHRCQPGAA